MERVHETRYALVDAGHEWQAVRHDPDGPKVFETWDRQAEVGLLTRTGLLAQMTAAVQARWGRTPTWEKTDTGWRAT